MSTPISNHWLTHAKDHSDVSTTLLDEADEDFEWDRLGRKLGIAESEIKAIDADKSLNRNKKLKSMIAIWLKQRENDGPGVSLPTWRVIYEIVQSLGYSNLAEYIATHYSCSCEECQPKSQQPDLPHDEGAGDSQQSESNAAAKQSKEETKLQQLLRLMESTGMDVDKMMQAVQEGSVNNTSTTENDIPNSQVTKEPLPPVNNSQKNLMKLFLVEFSLYATYWAPIFSDAGIIAQDESHLEPQSKTLEKYQQVCKHVKDPIDKQRLLQAFGLDEEESRCQTAIQAVLDSKCRIETLSDGLVLKGLLQNDTKFHDQELVSRRSDEFLLESCNAIIKDCLSEFEKIEYKHFETYEQETEFFNCIIDKQHRSATPTENQKRKSYASTCKIFYVPVASIVLDESSFKLSKDAFSCLEKIEGILNKTPVEAECEVQFACETFFERFGSHVSYGPYQVGGIYWLKAYSEDFKEEELEEIKQLHMEAVNTSTASSSSRIKLETGHAGGPSTASDVDAWKEELLDRDEDHHDSKWIIIDQTPLAHDTKNVVNIQKIVQMASCSDFDCTKISDKAFQQLNKAREQMRKIEAENAKVKDKTVALQQLKTTCHMVKQWLHKKTDDELKQNVKDDLQTLVKIKNDQENDFWSKFYLGQPCIQCYLRRVVTFIKNKKNDIQSILKTLQNVFVSKTAVQNLDFLENELIKWVYPPVIPRIPYDPSFMHGSPDDIARFLEFIDIIVKKLQKFEVDDFTPLPQITLTITSMINAVRSPEMKEFSSFNSLLLITYAVPFGYNISTRTFKTHLTLKTICDFKMHLEKANNTISSVTTVQKQLFLFHSLIKRDPPFDSPAFCNGARQIEYLAKMKNLALELEIVLCKCQNDTNHQESPSSYDIVKLDKLLDYIIQKKQSENHVLNSVVKEKPPTAADFEMFLKKLNCNPKCKKTLQDVLKIDTKTCELNENENYSLISFMTEKLKMSNYKCRSQNENKGKINQTGTTKREVLIHPMDSMFVLLYTADNFLRQDLYYRLNAALLPVPLLYTDPLSGEVVFPLWALRSIVRAWKCKLSGHHEERLVDCKAPLVSFIRFSRLPISKSSIANEIICGDAEAKFLFFNHKSKGSGACRRFVDGTLEACWYLPSGEERDQFDDVIAFANLRGNAAECPPQLNVIRALSFMCFVLISEEDLINFIDHIIKLNSMKGKVIFILAGKTPTESEWNKILTKFAPNCTSIHLDSMSEPSEIKEAIQRTIQEELRTNKTSHTRKFTNELISLAPSLNIKIDEDNNVCQKGKALASNIMEKIARVPVQDVKEHFTPLQGPTLWQKWASNNKEQKKANIDEVKKIETFNSKLNDEKRRIRTQQLKTYLDSPSDSLINIFIDAISDDDSPEVRAYFLQWLKFYLDDRSRRVSTSLREKSVKLNKDLLKQGISEEEKLRIQEELKNNDRQLVHISFGIEHLFRELGQIYESACNRPSQIPIKIQRKIIVKIKKFPKIAASLFFSGHPFEIVDGDAAHVPIVWVSAVLEELGELLKENSKLSVISVLGNQSTGKSTLINTMFGVRFAVGASRCTRGAFMQMIPVVNSKKTDYLIVVDTEGLNAPELMNTKNAVKHDRELATLVIGLADSTVVNISGENIAGGIQDILAISVHAFLRMRQVELKPSCKIVRHNVASAAASKSKEITDLKDFQEALDKMTLSAAKDERCVGKYKEFNDVITYNYETDLQDFPTLFYNPPMAPVNDAYCDAARKLKSKLIDTDSNTPKVFERKLCRLWEAVLKENYVFSFRNALELDAFTKLEKEYSTWSWKLKMIYVAWKDDVYQVILSTQNETFTEYCDKLSKSLHNAFEEIQKGMEVFLAGESSDDIRIVMTRWKKQYEKNLEFLKNSYIRSAPEYIQDVTQLKNNQKKNKEMKETTIAYVNDHFARLIVESELAQGNKKFSKVEKKKIKNDFDSMWESLEEKVQLDHPPLKQVKFSSEISSRISEVLPANLKGMVTDKLSKCSLADRSKCLDTPLEIDVKHFVFPEIKKSTKERDKKMSHSLKEIPARLYELYEYIYEKFTSSHETADASHTTSQILEKAQKFSDGIIELFKQRLSLFNEEKHGYIDVLTSYDTFCTTEFEQTFRKIDEFKTDEIIFSNEYKVDVFLQMGGHMLQCLEAASQDAQKNHPLEYLKSLKSTYEGQFEALCTAAEKEKAAAIGLVNHVKKEILQKLFRTLKIKLADKIKGSNSVFHSKKTLVGTVLLDMLQKDNFTSWALHLTNVKDSFDVWIKTYVEDHCCKINEINQEKLIVSLAEEELTFLLQSIERAAKNATKAVSIKENSPRATMLNIEHWFAYIQKDLSDSGTLHLDQQLQLKTVSTIIELQKDHVVLKLNLFADEFIKELQTNQLYFTGVFDDLTHAETKNIIDEIVTELHKNIAGCCEQCPFCKEQCEHVFVNHQKKHFCSLHRPECLGKFRMQGSEEMVLDICTDSVGGTSRFKNTATNHEWHFYKTYQEIYPDWYIPDESHQIAPYWKWFVHHHRDDITELFNFKPVDIPEDWKSVTKQDAEDDIRRRYFGELS